MNSAIIILLAFVLFIPTNIFAESPDYYQPPIICIKDFPDDSSVSEIKKKRYVNAIKSSITEWTSMLKDSSTIPRNDNWKWDMDTKIVSSFSKDCFVGVEYLTEPTEPGKELVLGEYFYENEIGRINLYYYTPYECETHQDESYIYYGICRSETDMATTDEMNSIFKHEFGHALGLEHDISSTSLMNAIYQQVPYKGKITPHDTEKVTKIFPDGFFYENPINELEEKIVQPMSETEEQISKIPDWIKSNARWWAENQLDDNTFVSGVGYLIKEKIIKIDNLGKQSENTDEKIPDWIKSNARWWADGVITEDDFIKGIKYLVEKGIIRTN